MRIGVGDFAVIREDGQILKIERRDWTGFGHREICQPGSRTSLGNIDSALGSERLALAVEDADVTRESLYPRVVPRDQAGRPMEERHRSVQQANGDAKVAQAAIGSNRRLVV